MSNRRLGVAIIGCGNIAEPYARDIASYPQVKLVGASDLEFQRAQDLATKYGCRAYASNEELLADDAVELAVNLTIHHAHTEVVTRCLEAGKHVHSEKPLSLTYEEAQGLVELAERKGLRLGCSPFTFMGEAQQTAWKQIKEGRLGTVRVAYAEVNWGRIEGWHPNPAPFYEVGALFDVGVYPLTLLTAMFGPARLVSAYGRVLHPDRVTGSGIPFHIETPDFVVSAVELQNGTLVRLTTNFYVGHHGKQKGIEFHGDLGSLYLSSWQGFNAAVEFARFGGGYEPVPLVKEPYEGTEWGRATLDMAEAIEQGRPHRATGEQAAHVVEILCAIAKSLEQGGPVEVHSSFTQPALMDWTE
jgi:predicted dehydrogenase